MRLIIMAISAAIAAWHAPAKSGIDASVADAEAPLILQANEADGMVEVLLRTNATTAQTVSYSLQVAGGSRTTHQGKTRIVPGASQTLSTVRINAKPAWGARLTVEPEGAAAYEQVLGDPTVI